jgi:hypothetical protein
MPTWLKNIIRRLLGVIPKRKCTFEIDALVTTNWCGRRAQQWVRFRIVGARGFLLVGIPVDGDGGERLLSPDMADDPTRFWRIWGELSPQLRWADDKTPFEGFQQ